MISLNHSSIAEIAAALRAGTTTAVALHDEAADRHRRYGAELNAYKLWLEREARAQAEAADHAFATGVDAGLLQGLPISIKDVFGIAGTPTFCGTSRRLPPEFEVEGPIVTTLRRQLATFSGKTHTVPFAFGVVGVNRHWGAPRNPWDARVHRMSGGSSSGAGVSLWEGSAVLALGSDAGGSIRSPAALTGSVGLRTSIGRWPVGGAPPLSPTFDTPGILARSAADLAFGFAALDPLIADRRDFVAETEQADMSGIRIGVPTRHFREACGSGVIEAVDTALARLARGGATLISIELDEAAEAAEWMARGGVGVPEGYRLITERFPEWIEDLDPSVWQRLATFGEIDDVEYARRRAEIPLARAKAARHFERVDVIATPTTRITAPRADEVADLDAYRHINMAIGRNLMLMNFWDWPSLTLPVGKDPTGLPIGMQLSMASGTDDRLMTIACAAERILGTPSAILGDPTLAT